MDLFNTKEIRSREKLFNSLVKNSDTTYIMCDKKKRSVLYMTKNVSEVMKMEDLETTSSNILQEKKDDLQIVEEIFELPILKEQLRSWDGESDFVSNMIAYRSSSYKHTRWLKIKIYPIYEKKKEYMIILISDATKEHEQQHLLVSQASDIKAREKQLNQITATSYDVEMDVNLVTGELRLHNLKEDSPYFGANKTSNYEDTLKEIIDTRILETDREEVKNILSLDHLKTLVEEKKLEPIGVRYHLNLKESNMCLESTAFFTENRGETHVIILTKDVTENAEYVRRQNAILQNALNEARQASEAKTAFLSIISHEIRTPLNAIIGLSESILDENIARNVKEDVESIQSASNSLLGIIDRLLDISKIESGVMDLEEKEYNVPKLLKSFENIAKERIEDKDIDVILNVSKDIPTKLYGDSGRISQVILNIIDNAAKFTKSGSITIDAKCEKKQNNARLIISVTDTGIGIRKNILEKLFDSSKKITTNEKEYVSGMGLSIASKLIDLLKGEIEVESKEGEGSTFTVSINQKIMDETAIGDINGHTVTKKNSAFNAKGKSILVVDDNKLNLKVAVRLLKPYEVEVEALAGGAECISMIESGRTFDLILLDQMMPEISGVETLHKLKEIEGFNIPVVVLTADAIVGKKEEYLSLGFDDYLSKPIDTEELSRILKKYLKN